MALAQAEAVAAELRRVRPEIEVVLVGTETRGDLVTDVALSSLGGEGIFCKEVQLLVLEGRADVAVHSAKDLPSSTPSSLVLAAVPARADVRDCLVGRGLKGLGPGATVATGAPRRKALLAERRPDLNLVELRGNIATRLARLEDRHVDAVVVAKAALDRLGIVPESVEVLDPRWCTPQVGQGALALEARTDDVEVLELLGEMDHQASHRTLACERSFLAELGAGCSVPTGAWARELDGMLRLDGVLCAPETATVVRGTLEGTDPAVVGASLASQLREQLGYDLGQRG